MKKFDLESAIQHCLEVAEEQEQNCQEGIFKDVDNITTRSFKECASEHRQLAEWLEELKTKRQIIINIKEQCKAWKKNDFQNKDYGTGFISALSNIEGLIAYTEKELKTNENSNMDNSDM